MGPSETLRTPLLGQRVRVGFREIATETMSNDTTRGLETPARREESDASACPECGGSIAVITIAGPSTITASPCGCRLSPMQARAEGAGA